jgi:putative transposase
MRETKLVTGEIYHVYNRGVEKRDIFLDESDYLRFMHDLFEFNDSESTFNLAYRIRNSQEIGIARARQKPRKLIVELMAFCLMPNHFHLLMRQKVNNGISCFMQKLGTGYTKYFNQKQKRVGSLFQGTYKTELVKNDTHLLHLPYYIHANPLDLAMPEWREREIKNHKQALQFLTTYRWSSFLDYIGTRNFPSVTQRGFLLQMAGGAEHYKRDFTQWLKEMDLESIQHLALEQIIEA